LKPHLYRAFAVLFSDRGPVLWIMAPRGKSGPMNKFLSRHDLGLHHIGLRVRQAETEEARMRSRGIRFVRRSMRDGREKRALIDPHDSDMVLLELVQRFPKR
jgi:4-hydroxyphenylpyruvate dioxygenase-like putative hemolysin